MVYDADFAFLKIKLAQLSSFVKLNILFVNAYSVVG